MSPTARPPAPAPPGPAPGPPEPSVTRAAEAYAHLAGLPLIIRPGPPTSGYVTIVGQAGTPYARIHLTLSPDTDLQGLSAELPAHLNTPAAWNVPLPDRHSIEYVDGYQRARRACLPDRGLFVPAGNLDPATLRCPYPDEAARDAFRNGAATYLQEVLNALHPATPAEDTTTRPSMPRTG